MAVSDEDIVRLKEIFVTRQECNTLTDNINQKLNDDSTELALIKQQLSIISWVTKTTLAAVLTTLVGILIAYFS